MKMRLEVDKWPLLSLLSNSFVSQIKTACIFGNSGNEAIIVCKNDDVFTLGCNSSSCLAVVENMSGLEPRRIDALCGKKIVDISYGSGPHVLAITSGGELYCWGHNGFSQLGNGNTSPVVNPFLQTSLMSKKVMKIACGSHHSLALTFEGEIYAWGQNNCGQIGSGSTTNQPIPKRVTASISHKKAVSIACGQTSSVAIFDNGEVYGWGYNGNGQLGLVNNINQSNPAKVTTLQSVFVTQIACGYAHTLALTDEGVLYSWGANSYGQLGLGNKTNSVTPQKVILDGSRCTKFVEVAAIHYNHLSAACLQNGMVLMWGQCRGQSIATPMETPFASIHEVFACFASPQVTWQPLHLAEYNHCRSIRESIEESFDDPSSSDVKFLVDGQLIHVHRTILKIRCQHFQSMFANQWEETDKDVIEINYYTYPVYKAFLKFLYTDAIDLPPDDAVGLLDLANSYCELQLKSLCQRLIKQNISVDNVPLLYAAGIKYEAKELENFCFRFCLNHMTAVAQTEAFLSLESSILKNFIKLAAKSGAFKH